MNRLPEEYEALGAELFAAAERQAAATVPAAASAGRSRLGRWLGRHTLAAVLIGLAATGTVATAAVVALRGEPSKPLHGALVQAGHVDARYAIGLRPNPAVGTPGWCSWTAVRSSDPADTFSGAGCGPAATVHRHLISGGFTTGNGFTIASFVVDDAVRGIRLPPSGRVVLTEPSAALPAGMRYMVTQLTDAEFRAAQAIDDPVFLDGAGRALPKAPPNDPRDVIREQPRRRVDGPMPAGAPCRVRIDGDLRGLGDVTSYALRREPAATPDLNGRPFLACGKSTLGAIAPSSHAEITVYVDAADPGAEPAPLTGFALAPGTDGSYVATRQGPFAGKAVARREGHAWVVVDSRDGPLARRLLARTTVEHLPG